MAAALFQYARASAVITLSLNPASSSPTACASSQCADCDPLKLEVCRAGCVSTALADVTYTSGWKSSMGIGSPRTRSSKKPSVQRHAELASNTFCSSSKYYETEESLFGDACPLYSSRNCLKFHPKLLFPRTVCLAASNDSDPMNGSGIRGIADPIRPAPRTGRVTRTTKETSVDVSIGLDGNGDSECNTGIPFLDHMLDQIASHGLFDLRVKAKGDLHIDDHHTNEDVALALGTALLQALGNRKGIFRFGDFSAPLDEAWIHVSLDLSGRPHLGYHLEIPTYRVGNYDTQLVEHFFQSLVNTSGMTLHIRQLSGKNSHHIIEATFKAFAKALRQAVEYDIRREGTIPSSKGILSRS